MPSMLLFMLDQLAVEFICQGIDGRIHVLRFRMSENLGTGDMQCSLGFLHHFFHDKGHLGVGDLVKMSL